MCRSCWPPTSGPAPGGTGQRVLAGRRDRDLAGPRGRRRRAGGRDRVAFGSGMGAAAAILDLVPTGAMWWCRPIPMPGCAPCWPTAPPTDGGRSPGRHHRHGRHQAGGLGRRPAVAGVADQPADRRRGPAGALRVRQRDRRPGRRGQHLRDPAGAAAACASARTWCCTARRSSSVGTRTCCSALAVTADPDLAARLVTGAEFGGATAGCARGVSGAARAADDGGAAGPLAGIRRGAGRSDCGRTPR